MINRRLIERVSCFAQARLSKRALAQQAKEFLRLQVETANMRVYCFDGPISGPSQRTTKALFAQETLSQAGIPQSSPAFVRYILFAISSQERLR